MSAVQVQELRPGVLRVEQLDGARRLCEHVVVGHDAVLIVDAGLPPTPGDGLAELVQRLRGGRSRVVLVITHPDADHRGGAAQLAQRVPGLEVWAHALDAPQLRDPSRTLSDRYRA